MRQKAESIRLLVDPSPGSVSAGERPALIVDMHVNYTIPVVIDFTGTVMARGCFVVDDGYQFWLITMLDDTVLLIDRKYGKKEPYPTMEAALVALSAKLEDYKYQPKEQGAYHD